MCKKTWLLLQLPDTLLPVRHIVTDGFFAPCTNILTYLHCTALLSGYKHFKLAWFTKFPHRAAKHICTSTV